MKKITDIKNLEVRKEIIKLQGMFEDSFINDEMEFIAVDNLYLRNIYDCDELGYSYSMATTKRIPKRPVFVNLYFCIETCETKNDVKAKVLEYWSRDAYKTQFSGKFVDDLIHKYILNQINAYLSTSFDEDDIEQIYCKLGNGCNHNLALKFIENNYDKEELK